MIKTVVTLVYVLSILLSGLVLTSHGQSPELAGQYFGQGHAAYTSGRYLEAAQLFEKSAEAEKNSPTPILYSLSNELSRTGASYVIIGQYDKALKYYEESLAMDRKLGKEDQIVIKLSNIGAVYHSWGQYDKVLQYFEEGLAIDRKLGKEDNIATDLNNIGGVYRSWGEPWGT